MRGQTLVLDAKRRWLRLAVRHLRMSQRLLESGFADGSMFHAYHAYECALSTIIAASGYSVPPKGWVELPDPDDPKKIIRYYPSPKGHFKEGSSHKARVVLFKQLADQAKPYYSTYKLLRSGLTVAIRNDALYYDVDSDLLPQQRYDAAYVKGIWLDVRQFVEEVRIGVR